MAALSSSSLQNHGSNDGPSAAAAAIDEPGFYQPEHDHMSRYSTPASELGRLAIGGSSTSSSGDMPVTTRAMRRGQASGSSAQQSSSRTGAGSSRNNGRSSGTQRGAQRGRPAAGNGGGDDSDDDDSSSDDSEDGDDAARLRQQNLMAAFEIAAAFDAVTFQGPRELSAATPRGNPHRRLANALASRFRDQADLDTLRGVLSRAEALEQIQTNFRTRYSLVIRKILMNVENASQGLSVVNGLRELRATANAIGQHITFYGQGHALPDGGRSLVALLFEMLAYITNHDEDIYAAARIPRAQYAGGGNTGNLFREFVRQHVEIMEVLSRLPHPLLRERREAFEAIIRKVQGHGASNGDRAQYQQLMTQMSGLYRIVRGD